MEYAGHDPWTDAPVFGPALRPVNRGSVNGRALRAARPLSPAGMQAATLVVGGGATAVACFSANPGAVVSAIAFSIIGLMMPTRYLVFAWASILPIYGLVGVSPSTFDIARLVGALIIVIRVRPDNPARRMRSWFLPLLATGTFMAVSGVVAHNESPLAGLIVVVGAVIAAAMAQRRRLAVTILAGFALGGLLSAGVLLMQAMNLPNPAMPFVSNGRLPGLSSSAPKVSAELAISCVVLSSAALGKSGLPTRVRIAALSGALICLAALFASGGRSGLAGILLATVAAARLRLLRPRHLLVAAATLPAIGYAAGHYDVELLTIERLTSNPNGAPGEFDVTTGRKAIFLESLRAFLHDPVFGTGNEAYAATHVSMPHFAPLMFAISAGLVGALCMSYLLLKTLALALARQRIELNFLTTTAQLLAAVLAMLAVIEPNGPFVGVGLVTVLFVSAAALHADDDRCDAALLKPSLTPAPVTV